MRTPYTKKIVELHKIHKAIENCNGGGDVTPTPEPTPVFNIGFPFVPGKLVGFVDNTNWTGYVLDYSTNIVDITGDIIKIEDIEEYCISKQNSITLIPILEYDETLDFNSRGYNNIRGATDIQIYYDNVVNKCGVSSINTYSAAYKGVKDKDYIILLPAGD